MEAFRKGIVLLRVIFFVGIGLLVAGSCLIGNYKDDSSVKTGLKLAKAGYLVFVFILVIMVVFVAVLWLKMQILCPDSKKVYRLRKHLKDIETDHLQDFDGVLLLHSIPCYPNGIRLPFCLRNES
jgi:hypothetical protein